MSLTPKIRLAVMGAGSMGQAHMAIAQNCHDCALTAVVDTAPEGAGVAARWGAAFFRSLEDLLRSDRPDAIIIATPNSLHLPHALHCISAGIPTLLEKPIATNVVEALQLVHAAEEAGARLLIGHHRAHSPIMANACEVIGSGSLGHLVSVTGSATFYKPDHYFQEGPWRKEKGGGPILLNMIHEVHNLRMLCGEITAVQAFASHAIRRFPVEDTVAISLRFSSGVLGTFLLSDTAASPRSWEQTSQENKAYATYPDEDCYIIAGTQGSLSVPTMRLWKHSSPADRSWLRSMESSFSDVLREDPLQRQMKHFLAVVRGEANPLVTARDGLSNLRVTEAIATAANCGHTVLLECS